MFFIILFKMKTGILLLFFILAQRSASRPWHNQLNQPKKVGTESFATVVAQRFFRIPSRDCGIARTTSSDFDVRVCLDSQYIHNCRHIL